MNSLRHFILLCASLILLSACSHTPLSDPELHLSSFDYPFPVLSFEFESQNQKLHMRYIDAGPEDSSKGTIVLLHGKNFAGFYWEQIALDLSQRGYRVIIPDQVGFGKSSKPKNYQYSFGQMSLNTHKLLQKLKIRS